MEFKEKINEILTRWNPLGVPQHIASDEIISSNEVFVAEIDPVTSKSELLNEFNTKLNFPYFGFNWDALEENLRNLCWIQQKNIFIVHKGLYLPTKDYEIYLSIAKNCAQFWLNYPNEHVLNFDFLHDMRRQIPF